MDPLTIMAALQGARSLTGGRRSPYSTRQGGPTIVEDEDPMRRLGGLASLYGMGSELFGGGGSLGSKGNPDLLGEKFRY